MRIIRDLLQLLLLLVLVQLHEWHCVAATAAATVTELWAAANAEWELQRMDETLALLLQIERVRPADPMLPMALGAVYQSKDDYATALAMYERALPALSENADLHANIAQLFFRLNDMARALESYRRAITLDATIVPRIAHFVALTHHFSGDYGRAEAFYELVPTKTATCHFDYGVTLERLGKIVAANHAYNRALALDATMPHAWLNVAALHQQYGQTSASIPLYLRVLELPNASPDLRLKAMANLGVAFEVGGDVVSALLWFDRALQFIDDALRPNDRVAPRILVLVHVARAKMTACLWANYSSAIDQLLRLTLEHETASGVASSLMPFDTLMHDMSAGTRKHIATVFTQQYQLPLQPQAMSPLDDQAPQLCVGYLSYDFADHPTAHLLRGLFAASDRTRVRVVAFNYGKDDSSAVRRDIVQRVDTFEDMTNSSTAQSVAAIRRHGVHILMDAQVHMRGSRVAIVAARPAPIVVNYLVYPGTSGAAFVDYLITDRYVLPAELAGVVTEKLVVLPHSYQVNAYDLRACERAKLWQTDAATNATNATTATTTATTATTTAKPAATTTFATSTVATAQRESFVFVNFNKPDKIEPGVFSMWMAILHRVPGSVLLLLDPAAARKLTNSTESVTSREIKRNIALEAEAQGVPRARIRFLPRIPKADHLKRHNVNGLFIDTFTYGAHSTATDALYAGLPFLTLAGDSHASRVGVSLLANVGMDELVTFSRKEYEDLAVRIATDPACATALRTKLRAHALAHPLFQTPAYTRSLEASQRVMYDLYKAGLEPHHIAVARSPS